MDKKKLEYFRKRLETRQQDLRRMVSRTQQDGRNADEDTAQDIAHIGSLDLKLWAALACPVKGLEFDEVVLLETTAASYPDRAPARHALYVGATRAAHQLWCVATEAPSPIVTQAIDGAG